MTNKQRLLIVEDDKEICRQLKWALVDDYELFFAHEPTSAVKVMQSKKPPVVTLDLGLPPMPDDSKIGMQLLGEILQLEPSAKVVVVTGNEDRENALQAISQGAWDYYHKPIEADEIRIILNRAFHVNTLEKENAERQKELEEGISAMQTRV